MAGSGLEVSLLWHRICRHPDRRRAVELGGRDFDPGVRYAPAQPESFTSGKFWRMSAAESWG
jgi:hypothetical protein